MFLLYHSEGCNIYEMVLHECYVNDLHTTTCSAMLVTPEKNGDWLGSSTGPHTTEVWTGKYARLCSKVLISHEYK
jgi:hypothetical protein